MLLHSNFTAWASKVIFIDICTLGYNKINGKGALETPGS